MERISTFQRSAAVPERLLKPMNRFHLNERLLADFLFVFSRFEFALKQAGFLVSSQAGADAKPDWTCFAKRISAAYKSDDRPELRAAVEFLLSSNSAPRKQVVQSDGTLGWERTQTQRRDIDWVLILVRRVRNNLFHGGKYVGSFSELASDPKLIESSLIVLDACLDWHDEVQMYYFI